MIVTLGLSPIESVAVCYRVNAITHGAGATLGLSCQMLREFQKIHLVWISNKISTNKIQ